MAAAKHLVASIMALSVPSGTQTVYYMLSYLRLQKRGVSIDRLVPNTPNQDRYYGSKTDAQYQKPETHASSVQLRLLAPNDAEQDCTNRPDGCLP